jgi:Concanavalin A-like lectin/glucanases superfamily
MSAQKVTYGFIPTAISNCIQWLDGADNSTIYATYPGTLAGNNSTVTQWNDKSGAGNHVYQNGAATCPTFTLASNALNFAGGGGLWNSTGYALSSNVSFFTVMISPGTGWGTWGTLWGHFRSGGHDADIQFRQESLTNGYVSWHTNNNNNNYQAIPAVGTKTMYSCTMSNGVNMFLQNSYSGSTTSSTYTEGSMTIAGGTVAPFWIGRSDSSEVYNGYICEIVYYNQKLSDTQRQQVESYLAQKWGLTSSLPTGHPGLTTTVYRADYRKTNIAKPIPYYLKFSPTQIAGCTLWIDAADSSSVTLSGSTVTNVADKSGNGVVLSNATGFTYPNRSFNGSYPSFLCSSGGIGQANAGATLGYNSAFAQTTPFTVFFVSHQTQAGYGYIMDSQSGGNRQYTYNNTLSTPFGNSGTDITSSPSVVSMNWISGTSVLYLNGTSRYSGALGSFTTGGIIVGNRFSINESWPGHICELIYYSGQLGTTQQQQVESYLAQKWGLTASLPGGHLHLTQQAGAITTVALSKYRMVSVPYSLAKFVGATVLSYLPMTTNSADIGGTPQTVTTNGTVTYTTIGGKQCAYFSNSLSNYLSFPYIVQSQLTLCFWLYCIDTGYYTAVSINNGALNPTLQVDINTSTNNTTIYTAMPNQWTNTPTGNYGGAGQWAHFAITLNYATYFEQLYINGTSAATATGSGSPSISQTSIWLGRSGDNGRAYNGYLRHFCYFPTVLTQAQIQAVKTYTT